MAADAEPLEEQVRAGAASSRRCAGRDATRVGAKAAIGVPYVFVSSQGGGPDASAPGRAACPDRSSALL